MSSNNISQQRLFHLADHPNGVEEIFRIISESKLPSNDRKITIVTQDGQEIDYELREGVNKKPNVDAQQDFIVFNKGIKKSKLFDRMRVFILKYDAYKSIWECCIWR